MGVSDFLEAPGAGLSAVSGSFVLEGSDSLSDLWV